MSCRIDRLPLAEIHSASGAGYLVTPRACGRQYFWRMGTDVVCPLLWVGSIAWFVGVSHIRGDHVGESLCGVWSCFPSVQALGSPHLAWLSVLMPPAVILARRRPASVVLRAGAVLLVIGNLSVACVV